LSRPGLRAPTRWRTTLRTIWNANWPGRNLKAFQYRDYGSLINLSQYSAVGTLMGGLAKGSLRVEGRIARLVYVPLYRMHQIAVFGWMRGLLMAMTDRLHRAFKPKMKLH